MTADVRDGMGEGVIVRPTRGKRGMKGKEGKGRGEGKGDVSEGIQAG